MIDPNLLRQLGWDEDLIAEVNRVAQAIDVPIERLPTASTVDFTAPAGGATTFRLYSPPLART